MNIAAVLEYRSIRISPLDSNSAALFEYRFIRISLYSIIAALIEYHIFSAYRRLIRISLSSNIAAVFEYRFIQKSQLLLHSNISLWKYLRYVALQPQAAIQVLASKTPPKRPKRLPRRPPTATTSPQGAPQTTQKPTQRSLKINLKGGRGGAPRSAGSISCFYRKSVQTPLPPQNCLRTNPK